MMLCVMCCCAAGSWPVVLANGSSCQSDLQSFTDPRYLHVTSPAVVSTKNAAPKLGTEIAKKADFEKLPEYFITVPEKCSAPSNCTCEAASEQPTRSAQIERQSVAWVGESEFQVL